MFNILDFVPFKFMTLRWLQEGIIIHNIRTDISDCDVHSSEDEDTSPSQKD
jgi:hypothetical protein